MNNHQRKEPFSSVILRISKNEFIEKLNSEFDNNMVMQYFKIGNSNFKCLITYYELEEFMQKRGNKKKTISAEKKKIEKLNNLKDKIPKTEFFEYYIIQNHNQAETTKHFNITNTEFITLIREYNCRKDKKNSAIITKNTKSERYGDCNYNNRESAIQTCLERNMVTTEKELIIEN